MIVFGFAANMQSPKSSIFLDNVTSLSEHKVSFMRGKTTSNIAMPSQDNLVLTDTATVDFGCTSSSFWLYQTNLLSCFSMLYSAVLLMLVFWTNCLC